MKADDGLTRLLAALGAIPFVACALLPYTGIDALPWLGDTGVIAAAYGLTIASFMAGVHWGTALNTDADVPVNLYLTSNVVAVAAWLSFLLVSLTQALALLSILFAYLLYIDFRLHRAGFISRSYWNTPTLCHRHRYRLPDNHCARQLNTTYSPDISRSFFT